MIAFTRFARNLSPGDVIHTGNDDYSGDLIAVDILASGLVELVWGVSDTDRRTVTSYTGIVWYGHFEADIHV